MHCQQSARAGKNHHSNDTASVCRFSRVYMLLLTSHETAMDDSKYTHIYKRTHELSYTHHKHTDTHTDGVVVYEQRVRCINSSVAATNTWNKYMYTMRIGIPVEKRQLYINRRFVDTNTNTQTLERSQWFAFVFVVCTRNLTILSGSCKK